MIHPVTASIPIFAEIIPTLSEGKATSKRKQDSRYEHSETLTTISKTSKPTNSFTGALVNVEA